MTLNDHLHALWDHVLIIIVLVVIGAGTGYVLASQQKPAFESASLIALGARDTTDSTLSSATQALYDRSVPATLAQIATSSSLLINTSDVTGIPLSEVSVESGVVNDANAVEVRVTGADRAAPRRFAMELASGSMLRFNELYPLFRTVNIGPAQNGVDTRMSPIVAAGVGGVLGLALGWLIALGLGRKRPAGLNVVDGHRAQAAG